MLYIIKVNYIKSTRKDNLDININEMKIKQTEQVLLSDKWHILQI